ncbi:VC2046/SO_2500 family protein [Arsukibacterium sp.]|uniref:VC2046/SO_2500 family protein n=1 Tax=Arsukibacterium sp. TaxID=1977258 RepID=UPI00356B5184
MKTIINEWQLDCRLNKALNQHHRADFSLWLAFLSPAIDEMAEFHTPTLEPAITKADLYAKLSLIRARDFAWQEDDLAKLTRQSEALSSGSVSQLKLQQYLTEGPLVLVDDNKKLASELIQNLDAHSKRRRDGSKMARSEADPTALYDILQELQQNTAA